MKTILSESNLLLITDMDIPENIINTKPGYIMIYRLLSK